MSAAELLMTATKNLMVAGGSRIESKGSAEARDILKDIRGLDGTIRARLLYQRD